MIQKSLHAKTLSIYTMTLCALFTALITVGAFVQIQFPVVPITLQTLFVILGALLLGAKRSALSVGLYLFLGLIGLPVFTKGGGPGYVLQPTFGYLLGFLIAAVVVGVLSRILSPADGTSGIAVDRQSRKTEPLSGTVEPLSRKVAAFPLPGKRTGIFLGYWGIGLLGILIIYLVGMIYMYLIMNYYMHTPVGFLGFFTVNLLMTFAGDVFKCFVAAWLTLRLLPILRRSTRWSE